MRNSKFLLLWLGISLVLCGSVLKAEAASSKPVQVVQLAGLQDMIKLNKGKVVIVNFFATWCPPCKEEIPGLVALSKSFPSNKLVILGLSVDQDLSLVPAFAKTLKINYPIFHAAEDITDSFRVNTIPHNVIFDTNGQMAANVTGYVTEADLKEFITILLEQKKK